MKIEHKSDYRVVVNPKGPHYLSWDKIGAVQKDYCESMAEQIKRHVDDVGTVEVIYDTKDVCSHCGTDWTAAGTSNGCCAADAGETYTPVNP